MGMEKGYSETRRVYIMFVAKKGRGGALILGTPVLHLLWSKKGPWRRSDFDHFGQALALGQK